MMSDQPIYTLRYPLWFTFLMFVAAGIGTLCCIDWFWIPILPFAMEDLKPGYFRLFLLMLSPIGIGFGLMSLESISVSDLSITKRWLGTKKKLEFASTKVLKTTEKFYVLIDAEGTKLLVRHLMEHSGLLLSDIEEQYSSQA